METKRHDLENGLEHILTQEIEVAVFEDSFVETELVGLIWVPVWEFEFFFFLVSEHLGFVSGLLFHYEI
jgi:hypothetical protein